jgi:Domain of unknown function (DUF222)
MPEAPEALRDFEAACAEVLHVWAGALIAPSVDVEADVRVMSDDGLLRVSQALGALGRRLEAMQARCAAGIAARSRGCDRESELARRQGYASAERLIAELRGSGYADAARLVAVGEATARRESFTGASLPAKHPHLAVALDEGVVSVAAADQIRRFLDRIAPRADRHEVAAAEEFLVERAAVVGPDGVARLVKQLEARLDPDGVRPREEEQRAQRMLTVWEDAAGMINLRGAFDPATGAPIKLAIESLVGAELHRARDARAGFGRPHGVNGAAAPDGASEHTLGTTGEPGTSRDVALAEDRTIAQMNADALADIARLSLASADAPPALRNAVVVARIDLEALESGIGHATIDGIDQPVSASTARELAASAGVIPMILGGKGDTLDLGRAARFFTQAQKLVLAERDGGCAWPGCQRPPSHTQAHHIKWWTRDLGPTDLDNGILLCSHHHHRVHNDGWHILIRDRRSWFIPPAHIDPDQRPRAGNITLRHQHRTGSRTSDVPQMIASTIARTANAA